MYEDSPESSERASNDNLQSDFEKGLPLPKDRKRYLRSSKISCAFVAACLTFASILVFLIISQRKTLSTEVAIWDEFQGGSHVIADCGTTVEEAKAKGCVWDLMSFGWTHPLCYNKAESERWLAEFGPWKWYHDFNATQPVADEDLPYTQLVYAEQGYHIQHCLYVFKLLHLAGMGGHLVTDEAIPLAHTGHCTKLMSDPPTDFKHINTKVDLLFARCVTLQ